MVTPIAMDPVSSGSAALFDHRHRPAMGERTLTADSAQNSPAGSGSGDRRPFLDDERREAPQAIEPERDRTADFAAAVIAGALAPTPQSMEELIRRIGASEIPEESQARLRDLLA
jgi:hypothetical protein